MWTSATGWMITRTRGHKLMIEDNLDLVGDGEHKGKWVDERKGKGKGGASS